MPSNQSGNVALGYQSSKGIGGMTQSSFHLPAESVTGPQKNMSEQFCTAQPVGGPDQGQQAKESMQVVCQNFKGALDRSMGEQPVATLAVAAAAAFVLGAIGKA